MLRITHAEINHPFIEKAITKLEECDNWGGQTTYRVGKYVTAVRAGLQKQREYYRKLLLKYAVLDEKGEPVFEPMKKAFKIKEGQEAEFDAEFTKWMTETTFDVKVNCISLEEASKAMLSPGELVAVSKFVIIPGDLEKEGEDAALEEKIKAVQAEQEAQAPVKE